MENARRAARGPRRRRLHALRRRARALHLDAHPERTRQLGLLRPPAARRATSSARRAPASAPPARATCGSRPSTRARTSTRRSRGSGAPSAAEASLSFEAWALFCLTETLLSLKPGPAVLLVVSIAMTRGLAARHQRQPRRADCERRLLRGVRDRAGRAAEPLLPGLPRDPVAGRRLPDLARRPHASARAPASRRTMPPRGPVRAGALSGRASRPRRRTRACWSTSPRSCRSSSTRAPRSAGRSRSWPRARSRSSSPCSPATPRYRSERAGSRRPVPGSCSSAVPECC